MRLFFSFVIFWWNRIFQSTCQIRNWKFFFWPLQVCFPGIIFQCQRFIQSRLSYPILSPNLVRVIGTLVQFGRKWNVYPHNISRMELVLRMPNTTESSSCWCQTFGALGWIGQAGWLMPLGQRDYAERIQRNSVTFPTQEEKNK